jgi:PAS domain S-box-containing protein
MVIDDQGRILLVNAEVERIFGYPRAVLIGKPVMMLVPERTRAVHQYLQEDYMENAEPRRMGPGVDLFGRRADGSEIPIEVGLNPIDTGTGRLVMATIVDISMRKRAAEKLATALAQRNQYRRRSLQAQEQEKVRLARELHDQTGQILTTVMLDLKSIEPLVQPSGREKIQVLSARLEEVGRTLHHVASELRPSVIEELGLNVALANYVQDWSEQFGIEADFHCGTAKAHALPLELQTNVYRIVQEALTNVAKHAGATTVSVVLDISASRLRLTIADDGRGFDPNELDGYSGKNGRLGLAGIRERLALFDGELELESSRDAGTVLFARIPLKNGSLSYDDQDSHRSS